MRLVWGKKGQKPGWRSCSMVDGIKNILSQPIAVSPAPGCACVRSKSDCQVHMRGPAFPCHSPGVTKITKTF